MIRNFNKRLKNEKGSLALEQILFIAAIAGMVGGVWAFYGTISTWFTSFNPTTFVAKQ